MGTSPWSQGSFLDAVDHSHSQDKGKSWDEGVYLACGWDEGPYQGSRIRPLALGNKAPSCVKQPSTSEQPHVGGSLDSAGEIEEAWNFPQRASCTKSICSLHSSQAPWTKYAGCIVFLAHIHLLIMCCFLGNGPYSVGLEEESKGNVMLNSVLEFKAPRVQEGSGHTRLQSPKMP